MCLRTALCSVQIEVVAVIMVVVVVVVVVIVVVDIVLKCDVDRYDGWTETSTIHEQYRNENPRPLHLPAVPLNHTFFPRTEIEPPCCAVPTRPQQRSSKAMLLFCANTTRRCGHRRLRMRGCGALASGKVPLGGKATASRNGSACCVQG